MFLATHLECCLKHLGPTFFKNKKLLVLGGTSAKVSARLRELECQAHSLNCDVLVHWGLVGVLDHLDAHLEFACRQCRYMVLEGEVLDASEALCTRVMGRGGSSSAKPSAAYIESLLRRNGWASEMVTDPALNGSRARYDWEVGETWRHGPDRRRMWICWRRDLPSPLKSTLSV